MKKKLFLALAVVLTAILFAVSLFTGKYEFSLTALMAGDPVQTRAFLILRLSRTLVAALGGFVLGITGFVYQTVFRNPLASPDIIGVASGASAGAAAGILFFAGSIMITLFSFLGAVMAVILALAIASADKSGSKTTIVLAGIAVHALAQAALMCMKLLADPEKQLSAIEFWIMGSLSGIRLTDILWPMVISTLCTLLLFMLHRQTLLLSMDEGEARMLGASVGKLRLLILMCATLAVSSIISLTGLISFVGLLAPHTARLITKDNKVSTMLLGGLLGAVLLLLADILARSLASTELPVSIFTSLLGAPFLILLALRRNTE